MIKFILWPKCFSTDKRQAEDMGLGRGSLLRKPYRVPVHSNVIASWAQRAVSILFCIPASGTTPGALWGINNRLLLKKWMKGYIQVLLNNNQIILIIPLSGKMQLYGLLSFPVWDELRTLKSMMRKKQQVVNLKTLPDIQSDLYKRSGESHLIWLLYVIPKILLKLILFSAVFLKVLVSFQHVHFRIEFAVQYSLSAQLLWLQCTVVISVFLVSWWQFLLHWPGGFVKSKKPGNQRIALIWCKNLKTTYYSG